MRSFLRKGLLSEEHLGFAEVSLLRTARTLLEDLPRVRVERALHLLSKRFPERALSSLRLGTSGRRVVVRDGAATWDAETGQTLLPFEAATRASSAPIAFVPDAAAANAEEPALPLDADALVARGAALEAEGRNREALDAYEAAALSDPGWSEPHAEAARVAEALGDKASAIRHLKELRRLR